MRYSGTPNQYIDAECALAKVIITALLCPQCTFGYVYVVRLKIVSYIVPRVVTNFNTILTQIKPLLPNSWDRLGILAIISYGRFRDE